MAKAKTTNKKSTSKKSTSKKVAKIEQQTTPVIATVNNVDTINFTASIKSQDGNKKEAYNLDITFDSSKDTVYINGTIHLTEINKLSNTLQKISEQSYQSMLNS